MEPLEYFAKTSGKFELDNQGYKYRFSNIKKKEYD